MQLLDVLVLEQKIEVLREEMRKKRSEIAKSLSEGATVESGGHAAVLDANGKLHVYPFRGAILWNGPI